MATREFEHYNGCKFRDPDNCQACALVTGGDDGPNYAAWPLAYAENQRPIPAKWKSALARELAHENKAYADNVRATLARTEARFTDGTLALDVAL